MKENKYTDLNKPRRQARILELVTGQSLVNQEQLRRRLAREGVRVTQATLSRDLKDLGLVKTPQGYALPGRDSSGPAQPPLTHLVQEFVRDISPAGNLLVVKTSAGSAQPVAAALDRQRWKEVVGTVAGDDTLLVVTRTGKACDKVTARLREWVA